MEEKSEYQNLFSPLNASIPLGMTPFTESLKNTYDRVVPFYENEIKKNLAENKNVLISAHGNSLRALCKYLFNISDTKINELEIPTPLKEGSIDNFLFARSNVDLLFLK